MGAIVAAALKTLGLRRGRSDADELLRFADLSLNLRTRVVRRGTRELDLTKIEFALLELFLRHPGSVLSRSLIFEHVWGFDFGPTSNSLNVYVGYLRKKTEADGEGRLIHTVRGVGYVLKR
jgi:two-component system response regulator MprA